MDNVKIKIFEDKRIRVIWSEETEQWYFSVVDVCEVLADTDRPRKYWGDLKLKLKAEGSELSDKIGQLKMQAHDGKMRMTDVLDTELILNMLAEAATTDIAKEKNPQGMTEAAKVAKQGGGVAKAARKEYELQAGKEVVSPLNALDLKKPKIEAIEVKDEEGDE